MIQPPDEELQIVISIAISLAPNYVIRSLVLPSYGGVDRNKAAEVIRDRVMKSLRRYHITREALAHEEALGTLPLFPEMTFIGRLDKNSLTFSGKNSGLIETNIRTIYIMWRWRAAYRYCAP